MPESSTKASGKTVTTSIPYMIMEAIATVPLLLARDHSHASQQTDSSADFCTIM